MGDQLEERAEEAAAPEVAEPVKAPSRLRRHWLLLLCVGVLVAHGVVFSVLALHWVLARSRPALTPEVTLGEFQFVGQAQAGDPITGAQFHLHVSLLDRAEKEGRKLLETKKYRVQQQIEQILRRAHGGDFNDPALVELRRLIQETINRTLGKPVIEDVMVTDLSIQRAAARERSGDSPEMAGGPPRLPASARASAMGNEPVPAIPLDTDFSG